MGGKIGLHAARKASDVQEPTIPPTHSHPVQAKYEVADRLPNGICKCPVAEG